MVLKAPGGPTFSLPLHTLTPSHNDVIFSQLFPHEVSGTRSVCPPPPHLCLPPAPDTFCLFDTYLFVRSQIVFFGEPLPDRRVVSAGSFM